MRALCPTCERTIDLDDIVTAEIDGYVDAFLCPECNAIVGVGEIRGDRTDPRELDRQ